MGAQRYDIVFENKVKAYKETFVLFPQRWKTYKDSHDWTVVKLQSTNSASVPARPGIYSLLLMPGIANHPKCSYLMYIGQTDSLQERFNSYLGPERGEGGRPLVVHFLNVYDKYAWFCYFEHNQSKLDETEERLYNAYIPPLNSDFKGKMGKQVAAFK